MSVTKITGTGLGLPTADGNALGGASNEWSDFYLADGGVIYFGNSQEITLTHAADDGLVLKHVGTGDGKEPSLTFQAGDNDIAAADVLGSIFFQAPDETTGSDAILVAAGIEAVSEGDFSATSNATSLYFKTGASEAATTKMTLSSGGNLDVTGDITGLTLNADGDTAASDNAAIGYTAAEGLILTGQGSTNDVTIKNDADADVITIATGGTAVDVVGALTAGSVASDAGVSGTTGTFSGAVSGTTGTFTGTVDINGSELILDANANTSITADTDDQIDIKIAGADDFRFTANNFNVLSGSTLTIDSGATITNSGTANNFGSDMESAYAGVLQANANFVDQVIFGPSVDGKPWNGLWNKASVFSSLMLATIEDEGSNTELNIWDLTEQASGAISTTPLATVDLANAATPTCVEAIMGYVFVGSEDGFAVIDPHGGSWAERTVGWPKTTSTSTRPTLAANTVIDIGLGYQSNPPYAPRTGGYLPTVAAALSGGSQTFSIIKYNTPAGTEDPTGYWLAGTGHSAVVSDNRLFANVSSVLKVAMNIDSIVANSPSMVEVAQAGSANNLGFASDVDNGLSVVGNDLAYASNAGFTRIILNENAVDTGTGIFPLNALINRTYNTGFLTSVAKGVWLANSKTVDRGAFSNTLTENGTVTEAAVESSAELLGYSGFSSSNNLTRASDADWDAIGTGTLYESIWFNSTGPSTTEYLLSIANSAQNIRMTMRLNGDDTLNFIVQGATAYSSFDTLVDVADSVWHKADFVHVSSTERYMYIDGIQVSSATTDTGSITSSGNLPLGIGVFGGNGSSGPATTTKLALARLSTTAPSADQIRQMYDGEKGMFVASAECLLQSGSTDAVLDVDVDPLSGKVIVTQTDAITIFDGCVVDSKPTVNSGASEKGKLWGALRAEQNAANAYVTAPAVDQRQVNEMVRGLANELPKGLDLGKAKAWVLFNGTGTLAILQSYNVRGVTDHGTGNYGPQLALGFKDKVNYMPLGSASREGGVANMCDFVPANNYVEGPGYYSQVLTKRLTDNAGIDASMVFVAWFGELENE